MFRYRTAQRRSMTVLNAERCPFCHIEDAGPVVAETAHARVTVAKYTYDLWEFRNVTDHLLVIPKRHVDSLNELTAAERQEVMDILSDYEAQNYNVYARGTDSMQRTERHQHTHLIRTRPKSAKIALYLKKPYFLFKA